MRISRFILLLIVLFFACFWFGGGSNVLTNPSGTIPAAMQEKLEEQLPDSPGLANAIGSLSAGWERTSRIISLPSAVETKLQTSTSKYIPLEQIGLPLQQAIIAVEDKRFYSHTGFDIEALLRASLVNLQFGHIEEGASTITQQTIKNLFLSQEQSFARKAEEFILAVDMEMRYPKEKILEIYLNTIYFGSGYYGISEASMGYFGKKSNELSLAEASMLAGLPNAPSLYSPYVDFQASKYRQAIVLETMIKAGYINPSIAEKTKQEKIWLAQ